jgi:hypothetical protein
LLLFPPGSSPITQPENKLALWLNLISRLFLHTLDIQPFANLKPYRRASGSSNMSLATQLTVNHAAGPITGLD